MRLLLGGYIFVQAAYRCVLAPQCWQTLLILSGWLRLKDLGLSILAGDDAFADVTVAVALAFRAYLSQIPEVLLRPHLDVADQGRLSVLRRQVFLGQNEARLRVGRHRRDFACVWAA